LQAQARLASSMSSPQDGPASQVAAVLNAACQGRLTPTQLAQQLQQ
jgi:hypothetical protein